MIVDLMQSYLVLSRTQLYVAHVFLHHCISSKTISLKFCTATGHFDDDRSSHTDTAIASYDVGNAR